MLDKDQIELNPGKRAVAKIKANSQWGYLAMNNNKTQFKIINLHPTKAGSKMTHYS